MRNVFCIVAILWSLTVSTVVVAWTFPVLWYSQSSLRAEWRQQQQQRRTGTPWICRAEPPASNTPLPPPVSTSQPQSPITLDGLEIRGPISLLGNNVLVKVKDTLTATVGGILLPDQAKERPTEGLVVAVGPGRIHPYTGIRISNPIPAPCGDDEAEGGGAAAAVSVLYGKFDGRRVEYNGEECQMIRDDDILLYYTGVTMKLATVTPVRVYVLIALDNGADNDDGGSGGSGTLRRRRSQKPLQTSSGVVIASQVMKGVVPCEGTVVKIGEGRMSSLGTFTPSPVQPGDVVKFKDYAGNDVTIEGRAYSVVKMVDILSTATSARSP